MFNKPGTKLILTALICQVLILIIHLFLYLGQSMVLELSGAPGALSSNGLVWNLPETAGHVLGIIVAGGTLYAAMSAKNMKSAMIASAAGFGSMLLLNLIFSIVGRLYVISTQRMHGVEYLAAISSISSIQSMLIWVPSVVSSASLAAAVGRLSWHKELDPPDDPYPAYRP